MEDGLFDGAQPARYLVFAAHHLVVDAVSWQIITDHLKILLGGEKLPEKTASYRQWQEHRHQIKQTLQGSCLLDRCTGKR